MASRITSDEVNFLVFRYLMESGFTHAAFSLNHEARIENSPVDGQLVPPGALVRIIQKGIRYVEIEADLNDSDVGMGRDPDFALITPWELLNMNVAELQKIVEERKRNREKKVDTKESRRQKKVDTKESRRQKKVDKGKEILKRKTHS